MTFELSLAVHDVRTYIPAIEMCSAAVARVSSLATPPA